MINVTCKGKFSTFEVPIDEKKFGGFMGAYWDGEKIIVVARGPYSATPLNHIAFGWARKPFGDCCGADQVTDFSYMVYNNFGLKDSNTPIDAEKAQRYQPFWEPWYAEVVQLGMKPAIGLIPSNISSGHQVQDRSEFYSWLKKKGIFLSQWKNKIYHDSVIGAYLFVPTGSKLMDIKYGAVI